MDAFVLPPPFPLSDKSAYDVGVIRWVKEALREGRGILQDEPNFDKIEQDIGYIMGDQLDPKRPQELASICVNRTKDIVLKTVAAMTDIHPLFGFKTNNERFYQQSEVLDKLARSWWVGTFADLRLADVIRYAAVAGTGYCEIQWDPSMADGQGDIRLVAHDPRNVIPIRPALGESLQAWEGVILVSSKSINEIIARFPEKKDQIKPDRSSSVATRVWTRAKRLVSSVIPHPVDAMNAPPQGIPKVPAVDVYQIYLKDRTIHRGSEPVLMGKENTSWSYTVYPEGYVMPNGKKATKKDAMLYPRGRFLITTNYVVLYDGPNPYWHGMFPLAKLSLDPWPWSLLGNSIVSDLRPMQDFLNEMVNGIADAIRKALRPGIIADERAIPQRLWQGIDTRIAGMRMKLSGKGLLGKGIEFTEPPMLPNYVMDGLTFIISMMDELSGVANLAALTQLNQMPGADSIERMMEALTPLLRLKGRLLEAFLREMGEMVKANFFQFYTLNRRVSILGEQGIVFEDFDFDPGTLIPSMAKDEEGYVAELDAGLPQSQRANWHHKNFTFTITPNSLLAISQISRKMLYLQLWRGGLMDPWTLFEVLEIPNGGVPPGNVTTITDRLQAAIGMGLVGTASPAGRKATGQSTPVLQVKSDQNGLPRTTISESG